VAEREREREASGDLGMVVSKNLSMAAALYRVEPVESSPGCRVYAGY
jgi:hypothetical protein